MVSQLKLHSFLGFSALSQAFSTTLSFQALLDNAVHTIPPSSTATADLADIHFKLVGRGAHVRQWVRLVLGFIKIEIHCTLHTTAANSRSREVVSACWGVSVVHLPLSLIAMTTASHLVRQLTTDYSPLVLCFGISLPHGHVPGPIHHTIHTDGQTDRQT